MKDYPRVSVFMPTYNQVEFVEEALTSALEQDYPNLQVVAGDDGSTDGTDEIIMEYARKYPDRVIALVGEPNMGITKNHNRVLKHCTGKYIAFHAGDDLFLPGKITAQVEWMEADPERVICGHNVERFDSKTGKTLKIIGQNIEGSGPDEWARGPLLGSPMVRRSAIPSYGYDERLLYASDWKFFFDCAASGGKYGYVDGVYLRYRVHSNGITSSNLELVLKDYLLTTAIIESEYPHLIEICVRKRIGFLKKLAQYYKQLHKMEEAETYWKAAEWVDNSPRACLKKLIRYIPQKLISVFKVR